jgi:hypothetical protein
MVPRSSHPSGAPLSAEGVLRALGLRSTMPRRVILDVVRTTDTHPTAAFVFDRVRRRLPRVSLGTVYRNLRRLAAEGLHAQDAGLRRSRFPGGGGLHGSGELGDRPGRRL